MAIDFKKLCSLCIGPCCYLADLKLAEINLAEANWLANGNRC